MAAGIGFLCSHKCCKEAISPGSQPALGSAEKVSGGAGVSAAREVFVNTLRQIPPGFVDEGRLS